VSGVDASSVSAIKLVTTMNRYSYAKRTGTAVMRGHAAARAAPSRAIARASIRYPGEPLCGSTGGCGMFSPIGTFRHPRLHSSGSDDQEQARWQKLIVVPWYAACCLALRS
jgi:hypothetical protein